MTQERGGPSERKWAERRRRLTALDSWMQLSEADS
jgi:hypothetical protein